MLDPLLHDAGAAFDICLQIQFFKNLATSTITSVSKGVIADTPSNITNSLHKSLRVVNIVVVAREGKEPGLDVCHIDVIADWAKTLLRVSFWITFRIEISAWKNIWSTTIHEVILVVCECHLDFVPIRVGRAGIINFNYSSQPFVSLGY